MDRGISSIHFFLIRNHYRLNVLSACNQIFVRSTRACGARLKSVDCFVAFLQQSEYFATVLWPLKRIDLLTIKNEPKHSKRKSTGSANSSKQKKFKPTFKEVYIKQSVLSDKDKQAICYLMENFGEWAATKTVLRAVHELIELLPQYKSLQEQNMTLSKQLSDSRSKLDLLRTNLEKIQSLRKSIDFERESIIKTLSHI